MVKNLLTPFIPYIILAGAGFFYKDKIAEFLKSAIIPKLTGGSVEEFKKDFKVVTDLNAGGVMDIIKLPMREAQYESPAYWKNKKWALDLVKNFRSPEQVLAEIKATRIPATPQVVDLLRQKGVKL